MSVKNMFFKMLSGTVIVLCFAVGANSQGADLRADIELRREWVARLQETELRFHNMLSSANMLYSVFYTTDIVIGNVNYQTETAEVSISISLNSNRERFVALQEALREVQTLLARLNATGRKNDWGLGGWPLQGVSENNPFNRQWPYDISVDFELVDQHGRVLGIRSARIRPSFSINRDFTIAIPQNVRGQVRFSAISVDDINDQLTIRSIRASGQFAVRAVSANEWASLNPNLTPESGVNRKGIAGIGYGSGFGSGFGGGGGGIDNLLAGVGGDYVGSNAWTIVESRPEQRTGGSGGSLNLQKRGDLNIAERRGPEPCRNNRSMASIRRVVWPNMGAMRHSYIRRLRENPNLSGTITVRFSINGYGQVTSAQMVSSTINHPELESSVLGIVRRMEFGRINELCDITEVTYPFAFTQ